MSCYQSENALCKHVASSMTFYVDLNDRMPVGETASAAYAWTEDETLDITNISVIQDDITIEEGTACTQRVLLAGRAVLIRLSGGTPSDDEVFVTVNWNQSDGDVGAAELRLIIGGSVAP